MKTLGVSELDLITFFGGEHLSRAYGSEWFDSDSVYEVTDQYGIKLSFALHPIQGDVRITMSLGKHQFYDWQAIGVQDIQYR